MDIIYTGGKEHFKKTMVARSTLRNLWWQGAL